ncbi:MAG: serine/threonine-protein phosphatase [Actinobacteria bacterium]|nr:serine/threonine-protein phosphatase [Actinomycetota bacterium]
MMKMPTRIQALIIATTLTVAVTIGFVDVSGYLPEITVFALIPVIAGTYYLGFRFGVFVALIAAASEFVAHFMLGEGVQHFEIIANTTSHTLIYILTAALIARLVRQLRTISSLEEQRSKDLDLAKKVYGSVFTPIPSSFKDLSIGSKVAFARELGGDYYFIADVDEQLFICLADISGKSTAAALFAALLNQSVIEALEHTSDLTALVSRVNSHVGSAFPEDMFVTMFCALISEDGLVYVNAGHPPPLLYSKRGGNSKTLISNKPLPLGIDLDLNIAPVNEPFSPGDILLATTDGIIESPAFRDRPYEKLNELLSRNLFAEAQELANQVFEMAVPELNSQLDDIIVICVNRNISPGL